MTEEFVAIQVEREPLEESSEVEEPVAAPPEHLHAVVEALYKPAGLPPPVVIRDLIQPPLERPSAFRGCQWQVTGWTLALVELSHARSR